MTRKQALNKALKLITDKELADKIKEILDDMPFTKWNEKTIFDTIDQFIIDNGRAPSVTDFKKKGLPPHPVIKLRFNINLKEFLNMYYAKLCNSKIYYKNSKEEWKEIFIKDYNKNKPTSAEEYNKKRKNGTPSWATVAKMFNITKWSDWLSYCNLKKYYTKNYKPKGKNNLSVASYNDLEEKLNDFKN